MSRAARKPVFGVSDHVQRKPGCTATEDSNRLGISDLGEELFNLLGVNKGADHRRSYCTAEPRHCFGICKKQVTQLT